MPAQYDAPSIRCLSESDGVDLDLFQRQYVQKLRTAQETLADQLSADGSIVENIILGPTSNPASPGYWLKEHHNSAEIKTRDIIRLQNFALWIHDLTAIGAWDQIITMQSWLSPCRPGERSGSIVIYTRAGEWFDGHTDSMKGIADTLGCARAFSAGATFMAEERTLAIQRTHRVKHLGKMMDAIAHAQPGTTAILFVQANFAYLYHFAHDEFVPIPGTEDMSFKACACLRANEGKTFTYLELRQELGIQDGSHGDQQQSTGATKEAVSAEEVEIVQQQLVLAAPVENRELVAGKEFKEKLGKLSRIALIQLLNDARKEADDAQEGDSVLREVSELLGENEIRATSPHDAWGGTVFEQEPSMREKANLASSFVATFVAISPVWKRAREIKMTKDPAQQKVLVVALSDPHIPFTPTKIESITSYKGKPTANGEYVTAVRLKQDLANATNRLNTACANGDQEGAVEQARIIDKKLWSIASHLAGRERTSISRRSKKTRIDQCSGSARILRRGATAKRSTNTR